MGTRRNRKTNARRRIKSKGRRILPNFAVALRFIVCVLGIMALSLSLIFIHDVVTQCDFFRAKRITVAGLHRLSEPQVLQQARIEANANILSVNLKLARKRLLRHPWIAEARVARELPDTIAITIREQEPLAVLDLGGKFIINTRGEVFKAWEQKDSTDLPLVTGLAFSDIRLPMDNGSPAFEALMSVLQLGQTEGGVLSSSRVRRIHVDQDLGLTLYAFDEKTIVKLGYRDFPEKLRRMETLLYRFEKQQDWTGFDSIDLVNPNRVVVSFARGGAHTGNIKEGLGAGT
ncbi:MAG: FtsQ-type POTRA domain-containing protein [Pseudomonadota bacterium]